MFIELEKTKEELAKEAVIAFSKESQDVLDNYKYNYQRLFNMIWNTSVHPQDFFDVLDTQAVSIFQTAQEVVTHIMKLEPSYTPPAAPYEYTINQDGTVTVGEKIESDDQEIVV
jgi:hypothetical protein